jgi:hypothetical protein
MRYLALATEDELTETVGRRLIDEVRATCEVNLTFRQGGYGYLKSRLDTFCQIARRHPVLLITDLDTGTCAPELIERWMDGKEQPEGLLFRVAVREVESWLLADHRAIKALFGSRITRLPEQPDTLNDPKATLLKLAKQAPRAIRNDLISERGTVASQGLGYNLRLCTFVREMWNPERAALRSDSLRRIRACLERLSSTAE